MNETAPGAAPPRRATPVRRQALDLSGERVHTRLFAEQPLPLVIEPSLEGLDLAWWVGENRSRVEAHLHRHGGVLFRGFGLRAQEDLQAVLAAAGIPLMDYVESATPRTQLGGRVYTSTEFPPEYPIALHNELSYVKTWPRKIAFFCQVAPGSGGETPIADVRGVYRRLDPALRGRFENLGWCLVRNYGSGLGLSWRESFHTESPAEVEAYCRQADVAFEWQEAGRLRTTHRRPAVRRHPQTGEPIWFNHVAFWHISSLAGEVQTKLRSELADDEYPYNTYYGDGSPIPDAVVAELRRAYDEETVAFPWQEGDLLLLDNMLVAHGRAPFTGPRRILAAMGEPEDGTAR